jgi:hypothetical protein
VTALLKEIPLVIESAVGNGSSYNRRQVQMNISDGAVRGYERVLENRYENEKADHGDFLDK